MHNNQKLNLIDNRVLHTMIAILCALVYILRYRHDFEIDFSFNLSYWTYEKVFTYFILDVFQYRQENMKTCKGLKNISQ